jgi:hypothetical protein
MKAQNSLSKQTFAMKTKLLVILTLTGLSTLNPQLSASPLGTAFTYQGKLTAGGQPASGSYDLMFTLCDASSGGYAVAGPITNAAVTVSNGCFTVALDFGSGVFTDQARWLEIAVRPAGGGVFAPLDPRQALTAAPYASWASLAANAQTADLAKNLAGPLASDKLAGTYTSQITFFNGTNEFYGEFYGDTYGDHYGDSFGDFYGDGYGITHLNASQLAFGTVPDARLSTNAALLPANQVFSGSNLFTGPVIATNTANVIQGTFAGNGAGLTSLNGVALSPGTVANAALQTNAVTADKVASGQVVKSLNNLKDDVVLAAGQNIILTTNGNSLQVSASSVTTAWRLTGNPATDPSTNFLGTTDSQPLELRVNGTRALRLETNFSVAVGNRALAGDPGSFVWADSTPADFSSTTNNQFLIRAGGGVGIGTNNPQSALHVVGTVTADGFSGSGVALSALNASQLGSGTVPDARLSGTYSGELTFNNTSNIFSGNGAGLWGLSANSLSSGTVPQGRLSGTYSSALTFNNAANSFTGSGSGLTGLSANNLASGTVPDARLSGTYNNALTLNNAGNVIKGDGSNLTSLNANNLAAGTVPSARLSGTYSSAMNFASAGNSFTGNGSGLTSLDANNLATGTVADLRIAATIARDSEVFSLVLASDGSGSGLDADYLDGLDSSAFWKLGGNSGTTPGTDFLGTTDNQPLEFKVNNQRGLRLEPTASADTVNVIGGSARNGVGAGVVGATIGGGGTGNYSGNAYTNRVEADFGTVSGGLQNTIQPSAQFATIGGGYFNRIQTSAYNATIGGGNFNTIQPSAQYATIGGGIENTIQPSAQYATIGGGSQNTIQPTAGQATIGGGCFNTIQTNAFSATIPGGRENSATNYAFAAGYRAKANHSGAFVWGDSFTGDVTSSAANSVTMRASGGYRLFSNTSLSAGVSLAAGGTAWGVISDRNVKKNFQPVDSREVLERLAALPVTRWNYQWEPDDGVPHLGPMAQDFKAAFYPGSDDKSITTQEADGVELAAIQGLNQKVEAQRAENAELKQEVAELKRLLTQLSAKVNGGVK